LPLDTGLEAVRHPVVNEKQVAALAEVRVGHMARHAQGPVERGVEAGAVLRQLDVDRRAELLADAAHGQERRGAHIGRVPLDHHDPASMSIPPQMIGNARAHDTAAHDDDRPGSWHQRRLEVMLAKPSSFSYLLPPVSCLLGRRPVR